MRHRPIAVGVDIGGTAVKIGAVADDGTVLAQETLPFDGFADFDGFVTAVAGAIRALGVISGRTIEAVGLASPGFAHPETGKIDEGAYNVAILRNRSLISALRAKGLPARVALNDGVAAALGEHAFGAAQGLSRFVLITLGTGVGGCVMIDGKPVIGAHGSPPEIGAMVLDREGPICGNGLVGTLEAYACADGFAAAYAFRGGVPNTTPAMIFANAASGDRHALEAIDDVCARIAQALGTMINMLNLEACLIGGGISQAGEPLRACVAAHLPRFTWAPLLRDMSLLLARTGNAAGLLGAAVAASAVSAAHSKT